ncbi:MAG TPA: rhomboid family intramembrane serine protease [Solirubrobacterales bacterium]|nr:rhomboid family intramembrane serine protease [Solirubrobacterales bacterium]
MTPTPVGMRCPECARQKTRVTRGAVGPGRYDAPATYVLIALNVAAFLAEIATGAGGFGRATGPVIEDFALQGAAVADGDWYRLLTGGFLHASLFHIGFNMFALYILGRMLEPAIGTPRFVALYFASLFAGSFGALALSDPLAVTVGASGAVFGLFGAAFVIARGRGMDAIAGELGFLLVINLALTFVLPRLSVGGHLGGLAGGLLCAALIVAGERGSLGRNRLPAELVAMTAVAVVSIVAALSVA